MLFLVMARCAALYFLEKHTRCPLDRPGTMFLCRVPNIVVRGAVPVCLFERRSQASGAGSRDVSYPK